MDYNDGGQSRLSRQINVTAKQMDKLVKLWQGIRKE